MPVEVSKRLRESLEKARKVMEAAKRIREEVERAKTSPFTSDLNSSLKRSSN